jgi:hypothetical protein
MADFQMFQNGNRVMVILDTNGSCEVSLNGAKIDGTLSGAPVAGSGTIEFLAQHALDNLSGAKDSMVSGPATLTEVISYTPAAGGKGQLSVRCTGNRDGGADSSPFAVKSHAVVFPLKTLTSPVRVEIYKTT